MGRRKGAKNKPRDSRELILELQKRGIAFPDSLIPASGVIPDPKSKPIPVTSNIHESESAESDGVTREKFELSQNISTSKDSDKTVYRCGIKICNKVLPSPLPQCPYCGAKLSWE